MLKQPCLTQLFSGGGQSLGMETATSFSADGSQGKVYYGQYNGSRASKSIFLSIWDKETRVLQLCTGTPTYLSISDSVYLLRSDISLKK